jgi:histone-lysine N-methyltransferase SETD3
MTQDNDRVKFFNAPSNNIESPNEKNKFDLFIKWLHNNGCKFPKLELIDYGNEVRGCHTMAEIEEDEIVIQISLSCLITVEMGKDTSIGKAILASNIELDAPKHIFLMIFMLVDRKNPNSFFKPYYDILPATLHNMPIFWREDELALLKGSYLLQQIEDRNIAIKNDYEAICSIAPELATVCTLDEFKWARMCVCSRNFGIIVNGIKTAALVPYADMLNHYRPRETKWQFDDNLQGFTIIALQGLGNGVQVYDSYGQKCNHRFLLNYGFSVENNVEPDGFCPNEVPILLEFNSSDPLYEQKYFLGKTDGIFPNKRIRVCICDNENSRSMFAMLRLIEANQSEWGQLASDASSNMRFPSMRSTSFALNINNEVRVLKHLKSLIETNLNEYPTNYDEDCLKLASNAVQPFSNERHALIQVKGEKEVLLFYKDFAETALKLLEIKDQAAYSEALQEVRESKHPFLQQYCRNTIGRLRAEPSKGETKSFDFFRPIAL